jgi:hypothetical protein
MANSQASTQTGTRASVQARAGTRFLVPALWTALALLLGLEAYLALIACGVSILGFQTWNCPAPAPERPAPAADFDDLLRRIGEAEGQLSARPACRADNPAPLQIPAELRQPPASTDPPRQDNPPAAPSAPGAPQGRAAR